MKGTVKRKRSGERLCGEGSMTLTDALAEDVGRTTAVLAVMASPQRMGRLRSDNAPDLREVREICAQRRWQWLTVPRSCRVTALMTGRAGTAKLGA